MELNQVLSKMKELYSKDNGNSITFDHINIGFNALIKNSSFITKVESEINSITKDKHFDINDIPELLHIVILTMDFMKNTLILRASLKQNDMKYIIYGLLLHLTKFDNNIDMESFQVGLSVTYNVLWKLVSISVNGIKKVMTCC